MLCPLARQELRDGLPKPGRAAGTGQEQIFFHSSTTGFQGDPLLGALAAGGGKARHRRNKVGIPQNTRSDLIRPRIPIFLRNQVYADCLSYLSSSARKFFSA